MDPVQQQSVSGYTGQAIERFFGINNVDPPHRLFPINLGHHYIYPLQQANNVDIDNSYGLASRGGYGTAMIAGTNIHSLWSNTEKTVSMFVDTATLYMIQPDFTKLAVATGLNLNARMSYTSANDRVYYTNKYQIGYIHNGVNNLLIDPQINFKAPLPAGQFIEFFRGCLYVAKDNIIYVSDPLCDYYDIRHGYMIFADYITMLRGVNEDGIYVGGPQIYFLKGRANEDYERLNVYSVGVIPYTDVTVNGKYIDESFEDIVMFTSINGVCMGDGKGVITNLTEARYNLTPPHQGSGFIREKNNVRHYINTLY